MLFKMIYATGWVLMVGLLVTAAINLHNMGLL